MYLSHSVQIGHGFARILATSCLPKYYPSLTLLQGASPSKILWQASGGHRTACVYQTSCKLSDPKKLTYMCFSKRNHAPILRSKTRVYSQHIMLQTSVQCGARRSQGSQDTDLYDCCGRQRRRIRRETSFVLQRCDFAATGSKSMFPSTVQYRCCMEWRSACIARLRIVKNCVFTI